VDGWLRALKKKLKHRVTRGTFNTNEQMKTNAEEARFTQSNNIELNTIYRIRGGESVSEKIYKRSITHVWRSLFTDKSSLTNLKFF
jgi:hypothetical protein